MTLSSLMIGLEDDIHARSAFGLVNWAERFLGMPYWRGTACDPCSKELYINRRRRYPWHYADFRTPRYLADISAESLCADDIGLIKGYAWYDPQTAALYRYENVCPDFSADELYQYCVAKGMSHGDLHALPDIPGIMLHRDGHVGVYIGGGKAIDARDFEHGCVRTCISGRNWRRWTYLPFIRYDNLPVPAVFPKTSMSDIIDSLL